jgi:hypothetical protein
MTEVEQAYQRKMHSLTGCERFLRSVALFEDFRKILAHQISQSMADAQGNKLRIQLAKRLYPNDAGIDALLEIARQRQEQAGSFGNAGST